MNDTRIPDKMADILKHDSEISAKTYMVINRIQSYFESSELYFFPEYTDHRQLHINNIIEIIDKLILIEHYDKLKPKDIAILLVGVYIHDIGMFLKPDGLHALLEIPEWANQFKDFLKSASRMSDIELNKLYGESTAFVQPNDLNNSMDLTNRDRLTYGDFLRRNHAAIAEYIAIHGFPGVETQDLLREFDLEQRKIIGLLAKSHCMSLRAAAAESDSKLLGKKNAYKPSNIPIVYLMALLRIADILDMGRDRAPHIIADMQRFSSPLSKEEWLWNQTIDSRDFNWDTARTLFIQSQPSNTTQFVKVKSNLKWFQSELDLTWAALCDFYNSEYELTINRITSNIFEQEELFKEEFLTHEAQIRINSNISHLLIEPLYNNDPTYAIRELLQNSVDACNMRYQSDKQNQGLIELYVDSKERIFRIKDNGIGMNEDVIVNYYLTVGANFKKSEYWNNITDKFDNVIRVGNFGIGFLAGFLLGSRISVVTRHIKDKKGYQFDFSLDDEMINVVRVDNVDIGTTIEINYKKKFDDFWFQERNINSNKHNILWYEWYHYNKPKIEIWLDGNKIEKRINFQAYTLHNTEHDWFDIPTDRFDKVSYKIVELRTSNSPFESNGMYRNLYVIINGFLYHQDKYYIYLWDKKYMIVLCSIIDSNNLLNINLSRNSLVIDQIYESLKYEILKWWISELLHLELTDILAVILASESNSIILSKDSFSLYTEDFSKKLNLNEVYVLNKLSENNKNFLNIIDKLDKPFLLVERYGHDIFKFNTENNSLFLKQNIYVEDHDCKIKMILTERKNSSMLFTKLINDIFSDADDLWIPYDIKMRKQKFKNVYKKLKNYSILPIQKINLDDL